MDRRETGAKSVAESAALVAGVLGVVRQMGVHVGRFQRRAEFPSLAYGLDPVRSQTEAFARRELDRLRATLGAAELEAAMARGAALDREQVVADILACETPEAYWGLDAEGITTGNSGL